MTATAASETATRIAFARTPLAPETPAAVGRVLASGWLTTGPEVAAFEQEFAELVGARHATAVASCTAALELSLRALHLPAGSGVLTSTVTFCGAVNAILHAGLRPVFVDVDVDTLMPSPSTVAEATARDGAVAAMVALHYAGHPADVEGMAAAAGLPLTRVVEDAAHAVGTKVGNRPVGALSAASCFSFYATKNLPIGEGGMVTTDDDDVVDYVRRTRLHGMSKDAWKRYLPGAGWRYSVEDVGLKANMTDIQATIGRHQMRHLDAWQARRREIVARYDAALDGIDGIVRPARPADGEGEHAWHLYVVRAVQEQLGASRDELMTYLAERGIDLSVHFIPVHTQPYMRSLLGDAVAPGRLPVADAVFDEFVSLPLYPDLTDDEVDRVADTIRDLAYDRRRVVIVPQRTGDAPLDLTRTDTPAGSAPSTDITRGGLTS